MNGDQRTESDGRAKKLRGQWVTVQTFKSSEQAHLVKLRLDRAGIPSYIDGDNAASSLWHLQPALGWIKLRVPVPFEQQAKDVLQSHGPLADEEEDDGEDEGPETSDEADHPEQFGDEEYYEDDQDDELSGQTCPACHSGDIARFSWIRRIGQALLVLSLSVLWIFHPLLVPLTVGGAIYLLITKPDFRCLRCGKRWIAGR